MVNDMNKESTKIIIRNQTTGHTDIQVLERALKSVKEGRISGNGTSYCYMIVYPDQMCLAAVRNKSSDTFTAY
jgi:hypothetical protein